MAPRETSQNGGLSSTSSVLFLFCLFLGAMATEGAKMSLSDREALVKVKVGFGVITSNPKLLKSWHLSNPNCTKWYGVTCNSEGRVVTIDLSNQGLEGKLSSAIGNLTYLQELQLSLNYLTGGIPESIGKLKNLKILDLSEQDKPFGGKIPASIGNLTNLEYLYLAYNKFNGTVPDSIGKLTKLTTLGLHYNNLEGKIPSSIKALRKLQTLQLFNNYFTGSLTIDANFSMVYLFENYFSGPMNITVKGKPYCSAILTKNCIFSPIIQWGCGETKDQKNSTTCATFCHANQIIGACGGHGTCSSVTSQCSCDVGYKLTLDKKYCYRA